MKQKEEAITEKGANKSAPSTLVAADGQADDDDDGVVLVSSISTIHQLNRGGDKLHQVSSY